MAKRIFAVLLASVAVGVTAGHAQAQKNTVAIDGCAQLARVIYDEVSAAALYGPQQSGPWHIDIGRGDISVCEHAAKTVSNAFTSAMSSAGIDVSWSRGATQSGDYCWGHFISQCYPDRNPLDAPTIDGSAAFVQQSWSIVSQAVMREMYNPHSSDEIRFRDSDLRLRIGLNLRSASRRNGGDF